MAGDGASRRSQRREREFCTFVPQLTRSESSLYATQMHLDQILLARKGGQGDARPQPWRGRRSAAVALSVREAGPSCIVEHPGLVIHANIAIGFHDRAGMIT